MRGARKCTRSDRSPSGIIPACAGSTIFVEKVLLFLGDHPRVCGEHVSDRLNVLRILGSSPRVRGALRDAALHGQPLGIIPACAGSTFRRSLSRRAPWDHPRVCGEHSFSGSFRAPSLGSSPRVRGAQRPRGLRVQPHGIIPACAGSTTFRPWYTHQLRDHPRVCGEH